MVDARISSSLNYQAKIEITKGTFGMGIRDINLGIKYETIAFG